MTKVTVGGGSSVHLRGTIKPGLEDVIEGTNVTIDKTDPKNPIISSTGGGGSMVYPGAGIALSTGSAWGTSITDNSATWNTAITTTGTQALTANKTLNTGGFDFDISSVADGGMNGIWYFDRLYINGYNSGSQLEINQGTNVNNGYFQMRANNYYNGFTAGYDGSKRGFGIYTGTAGSNERLFIHENGHWLVNSSAGTSGQVLTSAGTGATPTWTTVSGGGLTVGTSTITSGTNTKVLYNNSGVLGEYTVSGTGNVALTTSPVFTTPNIGTATGTASGNYSLASGGTATGTNTFAMGSNPFILTSGVTTGTGATAGIRNVFNSLTTGNGLDISTSSLTTGKGLALTSTSNAINHTWGTNALFSSRISGANANSTRTAIAGEFVATNTGTSSTNTAVYAAASGGTNNYSIYASGQMYVEGIASSGYVAYFKASGVNQGVYVNSTGQGVIPIQNNTTDLGNSSQKFKNAFFSGNVSTGGITTVLAALHSRGAGTTTGYNLLTENSGATARFGVRDNGAIEFSGSAGTSGQIPVSAGASSPPVWTDQTIQTVKVTVSSAEILALNTTPKTLIAAPGAGKIIDVISVETYLDYNSAAYTTNTTAWVSYNTSGGNLHVTGLNLAAGAFDYHRKISLDAQVDYNTSVRVNTPLVLYADSGDPLAGNSTYYVYVTYRIITL